MIGLVRATTRAGGLAAIVADAIARAPRGDDPRIAAAALARALGRVAALHRLEIVVEGPPPPARAILVANHLSYLDPVAILPHAPAVPIAKGEVGRWPVIGAGGRALGVRFVERDRPASRVRVLREALRVLRRGGSILNFPEGTTTDGGALAPFHRGIFGIAQLADAPVVPIALAYAPAELCWTGGAAFVPHYAWAASRARLLVHVRFGEPLSPARPLDRLIAAARAAIVTLDPRRIHVPAARVRVPAPRPVAVLPAAVG